jgi:hypothetical protein
MDRALSEDRTMSSETWLRGVMELLAKIPPLIEFQRKVRQNNPGIGKRIGENPWPHIHNTAENLLVIPDAKGRWHIVAPKGDKKTYYEDAMYGVFNTREEACAVVYIIGSMVADGLLLPLWSERHDRK